MRLDTVDSYTADTGMIYFMCFITFWFSCIRQIKLVPTMESAFALRAISGAISIQVNSPRGLTARYSQLNPGEIGKVLDQN